MSLGEMSWNIPLWFDIWLAGMAGGAYLVALLANLYSGGTQRNLLRLAVYTGVPLAIIGVLLLVIDLGTPIWFWHLFTSFLPVAVMSMGTWTLMAMRPENLENILTTWSAQRRKYPASFPG